MNVIPVKAIPYYPSYFVAVSIGPVVYPPVYTESAPPKPTIFVMVEYLKVCLTFIGIEWTIIAINPRNPRTQSAVVRTLSIQGPKGTMLMCLAFCVRAYYCWPLLEVFTTHYVFI